MKKKYFNPFHIANRLCEYFTNIGPNLAKSIPASDKSHRSFLNGGFINSFFLQSASEQEVTEICSSFRSGTAPGYDSISMNVVKESFNLICGPLTYIINTIHNYCLNLVINLCSQITNPYQCYQFSLSS